MSVLKMMRRRLATEASSGDAGTTMIEIIVAMTIMTVFMAIFTGSMLAMSNTTNKVEAVTNTSNQQTNAYFRLDREVRYASDIGSPKYSSNMWHVEFMTNVISRSTAAASSTNQCTQLAVAPPTTGSGSTGVLEQRTWNVGDSSPGAWNVLASYVTNYNSSDTPFPTTAAISSGSASTSMQQLSINLVTTSSLGSASTVSKYTFTALNSTTTTTGGASTSICQQFSVGS